MSACLAFCPSVSAHNGWSLIIFYLKIFPKSEKEIPVSLKSDHNNGRKGKAVPLQAQKGPQCSRKLRLPDFVTTTQNGGRLSALHTRRLYTQEILLLLIFVRS